MSQLSFTLVRPVSIVKISVLAQPISPSILSNSFFFFFFYYRHFISALQPVNASFLLIMCFPKLPWLLLDVRSSVSCISGGDFIGTHFCSFSDTVSLYHFLHKDPEPVLFVSLNCHCHDLNSIYTILFRFHLQPVIPGLAESSVVYVYPVPLPTPPINSNNF